jgi:hypothetical protein
MLDYERWTVRVVADHTELHAFRFASYQSKAGDTIWLDIFDMFEDAAPEWFHRTQSDSFYSAHGVNWHDDGDCPHDDCVGIALIMT